MKHKLVKLHQKSHVRTMTHLLLVIGTLSWPQIATAAQTIPASNQSASSNAMATLDSSSASQVNRLILAPNNPTVSRTGYLKQPIFLNHDFAINLGVKFEGSASAYQPGDSFTIGLVSAAQLSAFRQVPPGVDGFIGLPNVLGFKINLVPQNDATIPNSQPSVPQYPFGTVFSTNPDGTLQSMPNQAQTLDDSIFNQQFETLSLDYKQSQHVIHVTYHEHHWTYSLPDTSLLSQPLYVVFSAATSQVSQPVVSLPPVTQEVNPGTTATVTAHYLDSQQQPLAESQQFTGQLNTPYSTHPKAILGYRLQEMPANATGTFASKPTDVTYYYQPLTQQITIDYVYRGRTLHTVVLTGQAGETVTYANDVLLAQLKDYQILSSTWPGQFTLPNREQNTHIFTVQLEKRATALPQNVAKWPAPAGYGGAQPSAPRHLPDETITRPQADSETIPAPPVDDAKRSLNARQLNTKPGVTQRQHTLSRANHRHNGRWPDVVPATVTEDPTTDYGDHLNSRAKKPAPFVAVVSDFTQVLTALAHDTTFSSR